MDTAEEFDSKKGITPFLRREWHLAPRAIIAAIPFVGGSISVIVEDQIARRNREKILELSRALERRIAQDENKLDRVTNELFEFAVTKVVTQPERWKPRVIANILGLHKEDNDQLFKQLLIDHTSQLTDFDLAVFWDISNANPDIFPSETRYVLLKLQETHPEVSTLRSISEQKLVRLGFLRLHHNTAVASFAVTEIGAALIEVVK